MPNHDRERGAALIAVLLLMGTIGVLVASAVAVSQYATAETDTFAALQRSALEAESAANRTLCLLLSDRLRHADRRLGRRNDDRKERFLADGTEHIHMQGDGRISIRIFDAVAGLDLSGRAPIRQLSPRGTAKSEAREQVLARLEDYVDADDLVRNQSMEMPHYRAAGIPVLPRNRPLQFREEWLWIPGTAHIYPPSADGRLWTFRVIPPENMRPLAGRPNLLATPAAIIAEQCGLVARKTGPAGGTLIARPDGQAEHAFLDQGKRRVHHSGQHGITRASRSAFITDRSSSCGRPILGIL